MLEGEDNEAFNLTGKDDNDDCELAPAPAKAASSMLGPSVAPRPEVKPEEGIYGNVDQGETRVKVEALETYIKDKKAERGGFEAEFSVSCVFFVLHRGVICRGCHCSVHCVLMDQLNHLAVF